ncbi:bifunctional glycosyltransferase/CDP-glycerol:glycerophosphate glycerophosphotransferase [Bailinhaonella thermotolerans]|uniref:Glycosyltransferase n=1 Tax=Bailinhaonella thermotolerans TaxID=1070861 RepID=A0A3A4AC68_9ACTN|nr:bifunctional glycosyltransferase/CDP-glycerol:glycerophosphate glycerophosphotransferase [Bailinhaonella thermotolerans]RJL23620.1 glycosyltransferase [Bailinhaonella thermotolerans]
MTPRLSVVVPFYNVEAYLDECLESLAAQTLRDVEFVLVDDGSSDGGEVIAKAWAERDPRFRLVSQENRGLGPARNAGAAEARGRYLAFADSDDVLPRYAYEQLVGSLEETGSDLACGNVRRFTSTAVRPSPLHARPFRRTARRTHVSRDPDLLLDRTAWNKVFRRDFWDEHGLEFPAGLYEDAPVTIPAHVLARSVDVFSAPVYFWRERESGEPSITQLRTQAENLAARLASIRRVRDFMRSHATPYLRDRYEELVLRSDLPLYVKEFDAADDEYRERLLTLVGEYLATVPPEVLSALPFAERLMYHLVAHGMADELRAEQRAAREGRGQAPVARRLRRWHAEHPLREDRRFPRELFRVAEDELELVCRADRVRWRDDGRLSVSGHAYVPGLDLSGERDAKLKAWLRNTRSGRRLALPVRRVCRPDVTAGSDQAVVCYNWSGFEADVDPAAFGPGSASSWELQVEVTTRGLTRRGGLAVPSGSPARRSPGREIAPGVWLRAMASEDDVLTVKVQPVSAAVGVCALAGDVLELRGWGPALEDRELLLRLRRGTRELRVPVEADKSVRGGFRARVPLVELAVTTPPEHAVRTSTDVLDAGVHWDLYLDTHGRRPVRVAADRALAETRFGVGSREIALVRTRAGNLSFVERSVRAVLTEVAWTAGGRLTIAGDYTDPEDRPDRLILRRRGTGEEHGVPLRWSGGHFTGEFAPAAMPLYGELTPLRSGSWDLLTRGAAGDRAVHLSQGLLEDLPDPRELGMHRFQPHFYRGDRACLVVQRALGGAEGRYAQRVLAERDYPVHRARVVRDLVVFESWRGRQYSDSPREIHRELVARGYSGECVWVSADGQVVPPEGTRVVARGSREHYEALGTASHVISNDNQPDWYVKRPGQTYVQTWHGTPLKRVGHDIGTVRFATGSDYLRRFSLEVAKWDLLVSPNAFSTPIFQRAFRYGGAVLESGYPRNDPLHREEGREETADRVLARLGLPEGKRVVLYAPTWRDDRGAGGGRYRLDVHLDLDRARRTLGEDHVLLVRGHLHTANALPEDATGFVRDVTRYPDVTELLLITDVLVTDYSSLMFDFAGTGRPMVFYTYDLEHYRDDLRGFYFDLESEAPGPLVRTGDELIDALREPDAGPYRTRYEAFRERFCHLDDGNAAGRVVDRLFPGL